MKFIIQKIQMQHLILMKELKKYNLTNVNQEPFEECHALKEDYGLN